MHTLLTYQLALPFSALSVEATWVCQWLDRYDLTRLDSRTFRLISEIRKQVLDIFLNRLDCGIVRYVHSILQQVSSFLFIIE